MLERKIGVRLASLRQPLKKALHTAAQLGAEAVEIDARGELKPSELSQTGIRHLLKMLENLNLRVCAVGFATRRGYEVAEDLDRRIDATKAAMRMAFSLGAGSVVNQIGRLPGENETSSWATITQSLTDLGQFGQHVGAMLAAETGATTLEEWQRLLDAVPVNSFHLCLNPGESVMHGQNPEELVAGVPTPIGHVRISDGARDLARGRGVQVPIGRGSVDFPAVLASLEQHGYRGYLCVVRDECEEPVEDIANGIQYLKSLFE